MNNKYAPDSTMLSVYRTGACGGCGFIAAEDVVDLKRAGLIFQNKERYADAAGLNDRREHRVMVAV
jgi:hypothetical protein